MAPNVTEWVLYNETDVAVAVEWLHMMQWVPPMYIADLCATDVDDFECYQSSWFWVY